MKNVHRLTIQYSDISEDDVEGWINWDDAGYEQDSWACFKLSENDSRSNMEDDEVVANECPISNTDAADDWKMFIVATPSAGSISL